MHLHLGHAEFLEALFNLVHHARRPAEVDVALKDVWVGRVQPRCREWVVAEGERFATPCDKGNLSVPRVGKVLQLTLKDERLL